MRDFVSSLWRFLVDISCWVISRMSFCMRQQMCRLKAQVFIAFGLSVSTSRSKLRQDGGSHVLLEEIAYIFNLALLRMTEGNTDHNGHSYSVLLRRNMGSWDSMHVYVMASLLPFQLGRIASWERLALSVHLLRALRFGCFSHGILNMTLNHRHHWFPARSSRLLLLQVVAMNGNSVDISCLSSCDRHHEKHTTGCLPKHPLPSMLRHSQCSSWGSVAPYCGICRVEPRICLQQPYIAAGHT